MKLSQFTDLLQAHPEKPFHLILPGQTTVPVCYHVTEVGHVTKKFIDCGGKLHITQSCQLQAWVSTDTDHRFLAGKMVTVLNQSKAKGVLPEGEDLDVEIEYEDTSISQYTISDYSITEDAIVLNLGSKHTDCLAKDTCLPKLPVLVGAEAACCGGSGCC